MEEKRAERNKKDTEDSILRQIRGRALAGSVGLSRMALKAARHRQGNMSKTNTNKEAPRGNCAPMIPEKNPLISRNP